MFSKTALLAILPTGVAVLAGAALPFQAAGNAALGRELGHPAWGALASLTVSVIITLAVALLLRVPGPALGRAMAGPWWLWLGGLLGALYLGSAAAVTPKLGAGGFLAWVVAGQMVTALIVDHFGLMGLEAKPVSLHRVVGVALILIGVFCAQGSTTAESGAPARSATA
ncbi:DMT family transporter [Massilia sp. METH4]|uniref:DMT family transporter n=1 Tax=Massilia sp. METH4 TaxID=3123041 RepID=UPI0030D0C346